MMNLFDYLNSEELPLPLVIAIGLFGIPDNRPEGAKTSEEADMILERMGY